MLLAAIFIGLITAYYFGLKWGGTAAAAALLLFAASVIVPPVAPYAYVAVALGLIGIFAYGPKVAVDTTHHKSVRWLRRAVKTGLKKIW